MSSAVDIVLKDLIAHGFTIQAVERDAASEEMVKLAVDLGISSDEAATLEKYGALSGTIQGLYKARIDQTRTALDAMIAQYNAMYPQSVDVPAPRVRVSRKLGGRPAQPFIRLARGGGGWICYLNAVIQSMLDKPKKVNYRYVHDAMGRATGIELWKSDGGNILSSNGHLSVSVVGKDVHDAVHSVLDQRLYNVQPIENGRVKVLFH